METNMNTNETKTTRTYYDVERALIFGNGEDEPYELIEEAYELYWTLDGAHRAARVWRAKGWSVRIDGPHELPAGCETKNIRY